MKWGWGGVFYGFFCRCEINPMALEKHLICVCQVHPISEFTGSAWKHHVVALLVSASRSGRGQGHQKNKINKVIGKFAFLIFVDPSWERWASEDDACVAWFAPPPSASWRMWCDFEFHIMSLYWKKQKQKKPLVKRKLWRRHCPARSCCHRWHVGRKLADVSL